MNIWPYYEHYEHIINICFSYKFDLGIQAYCHPFLPLFDLLNHHYFPEI